MSAWRAATLPFTPKSTTIRLNAHHKRPRKRMTTSSRFDYGWVVVAAGTLMTCVSIGAMLSLAVFLQPISGAMGWSRAGVSAAATLDFLFMGFAAFAWGALSDRFGTRIVVFAGTVIL